MRNRLQPVETGCEVGYYCEIQLQLISGIITAHVCPLLSSPVVRVVTAGDVSEGKYTMHDVVIPLAGANTVLPANSVGRR